MIVADANLIVYLILPGERTEVAEIVFLADPVWVVPVLCVSELRSVVSQYVRKRDLTLAQGAAAIGRAAALIDGREASVNSRQVLELAHSSGCSSYDCEYVALAMSLEVPVVTSDKVVLRAFPRVAISPDDFSAG